MHKNESRPFKDSNIYEGSVKIPRQKSDYINNKYKCIRIWVRPKMLIKVKS